MKDYRKVVKHGGEPREVDSRSPRQKRLYRNLINKLISRQREHGPGGIPISKEELTRLEQR